MLSKGEDAMPSWHHCDPSILILGVCPQETYIHAQGGHISFPRTFNKETTCMLLGREMDKGAAVHSFNKFYRAGKNEETGFAGIRVDTIHMTETYGKQAEQVADECLGEWHDATYVVF